jgi:hypothetical protein
MSDAMPGIRDQTTYSFDTAVPVGGNQSKIKNLHRGGDAGFL